MVLVVKNLLAHAGDPGDVGSIPGLGRSLEVGNGKLLQYSCLENPMNRGAWWAASSGGSLLNTTGKNMEYFMNLPIIFAPGPC